MPLTLHILCFGRNVLNKIGRDKPVAKITRCTESICVILSGSEGTAPLLFRSQENHAAGY